MDLSRKAHTIKLAPINGVKQPKQLLLSVQVDSSNRLKSGCTQLMYACQQGITDQIVKEVRLEVNKIRHRHRHPQSNGFGLPSSLRCDYLNSANI